MYLEFDATEVKTTTALYSDRIHVEIETQDENEVLDNFQPNDIVEYYDRLEELYEALKEKFETNE